MDSVIEGQRYWKRGDHVHTWIVDAVVPATEERAHYAILVAENGELVEEIDIAHLLDRHAYTPIPDEPHRVAPE